MPKSDTVLLSETAEGNYLVRRYRVERMGDADYSVYFQINLSQLSPKFGANPRELGDLDDFVRSLMQDSLRKVRSVSVTGCSSPDGPHAFNERLAKARTQSFIDYLNRTYDFSSRFDVRSSSVAEDWESCRRMVDLSTMPRRAEVLAVIDSRDAPDVKEARLKRMPEAWNYLKSRVLPSLRRVEVVVSYGYGSIFEQRTMIAPPEPAPTPRATEQSPCSPCDYIVDEGITGIIVEMPE